MKKTPILLVALLFAATITTSAQNKRERIIASYLIAFGQEPQSGEINYWLTDPLSSRSLKELVEKHRQNTGNNKDLRLKVINNAYMNAMGRIPEPSEVAYWMDRNENYLELFASHVKFLKDYQDKWKWTINMSYLREWNRNAKPEEINYWVNQSTVQSYLDLIYNHKINKLKDPAWSKATNTQVVSQLKMTPPILQEAKVTTPNNIAAGVISTGGLNVISTGGLNVISTGGLNVISTGGLN